MKQTILLTLFLSVFALAEEDNKATYLMFEDDYMSNDISLFEPWLNEDYKLVQTLNVPGMGSDTRVASRSQLISAMKSMRSPNSIPRSSRKDTNIEIISDSAFCGSSHVFNETFVGGKNYEEKEIRRVCFSKIEGTYRVTSHNVDVHYREI